MHLTIFWHKWRQGSQDYLENKAHLRTCGGDSYLWAQNTKNHILIMQSVVLSPWISISHTGTLDFPLSTWRIVVHGASKLWRLIWHCVSKTTLLLHGYAVYLSHTANWMHGSIYFESKSRWRNSIKQSGKTIAGEINALCAPWRTWRIDFCSM